MIPKVKKWLENPSRNYVEGLGIFNEHASPEIKSKYAKFLELKKDETGVKSFDPRFGVLVNKVVAIHAKMKLNPGKYIIADTPSAPIGSLKEEILAKSKAVKKLESEKEQFISEKKELLEKNRKLAKKVEELTESEDSTVEDLNQLQSEIDDMGDEINGYQSELEEKESEIEALKKELQEKIAQSGLKVVKYDALPTTIKSKFNRTKEIVPLMAKIHAELSDTAITDVDRKKEAAELCALDDERRKIWDEIDAWSEGKDCILDEPREIAYSDDPLVKGMQVTKRMERLEENIKRTKEAVEKHIATGKKNLEATAKERLAAYEKELSELKAIIVSE